NHIQYRLSCFPFNSSETGISTDETFEITNLRIDVHGFVNSIIPHSCKPLQHSIACHGTCIPMPALYLIEWVSYSSIISLTAFTDNIQALFHLTFHHQMTGNLIFDTGPDFIAVYKRQ